MSVSAGTPQQDVDRQQAGKQILFAVDSRFPGLGGAERQALKLAVALREKGASVEFVTPRVLKSQSLQEECDGFTIRRLDYPHIRWVGSLFLMAVFARYLYVNRSRFDAVHIHITHLLAASAGFIRRWSGLPVVTKISGYYEFEGGVLDQRKRFFPLNFLIRMGLRQVDFVQTISKETRDKLLLAGFRDEQIRFIPNGIDTRVPPVKVAGGATLTLGYCGRLREVKGVHVLLEGFALASKQRPQQTLRLSIAGSGDTAGSLRQQAISLGVADQIDWLGVVEDTAPFYQALDIYIQPSFAEGLPNSVMEAMLEQRPVIASDIRGNNELINDGETGLRFIAGDAQDLSDKIVRLIDSPVQRAALAMAGRQLILDRFGFEGIVESLAELYNVES